MRGERTSLTTGGFLLVLGLTGCNDGWGPPDGSRGPTIAAPSASPGATATATDDECVDRTGFDGRGCYKCPPTTTDQLLRACTTSHFEVFDNGRRIAGWDPNNTRPPLTNGAPTPPPFDAPTTVPTTSLPPSPPCALDALPNPVMVLGATGFPMETFAKAMGTAATMVYLERGSCDGVASMVLNQPKLGGEVVYFDASGRKNSCVLTENHPADIALSTLFAGSCANQSGLAQPVALPSEVEDLLGPVNPVLFAAPATSVERAISAEAAYRVYGLGSRSGVTPWNDENFIFRRHPGSGNQQTVARALGLPVDLLRGRDSNGSSNMLRALMTSTEPQKTIGISSAEIVAPNRDAMKILAYQHYGQPVGFYPDSDPAGLDRRNVRDGHYFMWLPLHVLVRTSLGDPASAPNPVLDPTGSKKAARDAAVKWLAYVLVHRQQAPLPAVDLFGALKRTGNVPQCAMHVQRANEGAPLVPYTPPVSCDCAFEAAHPGTTNRDCTPCRDASQCSAAKPTCSFGFCE